MATDEDLPSVLEVALDAFRHGLNVIPIKEDGSKAPDLARLNNRFTHMASEKEITYWYSEERSGLGVVCGDISGGLEMFEFEGRAVAEGSDHQFFDTARQLGLASLIRRIANGYMERTPTGGIHLLYRCEEPKSQPLARRQPTPEELARKPDEKVKVLIETKGEGGYVVVAPSYGLVHDSGKPWVLERGGFDSIITITAQEHAQLLRLARTFDCLPEDQSLPVPAALVRGTRPGDVYNDRVAWDDVLCPHGWRRVHHRHGVTYWCRPGKDSGVSGTTGHAGRDLLHVFTTSTAFEAEKSYTKFTAYAILEHNGDFSSAAEALYEEGYRGADSKRPEPDDVLARVERELLLVPDDRSDFYDLLVDEDGLANLPEQEWLIDGWVPKGGYSIVFGPAGTGKTLVLVGMAKGVSRGKRWQKAACRHGAVLFLEGEGLGQLKDRVAAWDQAYARTGQEAGIRFSALPLDLTRPEGVAEVIRTVEKMQANLGTKVELVVIDPLAEFMTGDENLLGMAAVSKSLRVLAQLLDCAVLVGHHSPQEGNRERGYGMLRDKALVSCGVERTPDGVAVVQRKNRHAERRAIELFFRPEGDSVIFEYSGDESTEAAYDAEKGRRVRAAKDAVNPEKRAKSDFNSQRALNIVLSVTRDLKPDDRLSQNKLVERCLEAAAREHAENPGFGKVGRPMLTGHVLALAEEGVELVVQKPGQAKVYRSPISATPDQSG